jgi:hypothetical protein
MGGILRLALQSSHATAISCISLDFAGAALAAVDPVGVGQSGVVLVLQLLAHCMRLLQQVIHHSAISLKRNWLSVSKS